MRFRRLLTLLSVCLLTGFNLIVYSQQSAALSGQIVDPSKALVIGATVTLTDLQRGAKRTTLTNESGTYVFDPLEPGEYSLVAKSKGFADLKVDRIVLQVRDRQSMRLELTLAETSDSVTVEGRAEAYSADASAGVMVAEDALRFLPLNGRSVQSLLSMAPGVQTGAGPGGEPNSNGLRSNTNYYMLDGVSLSGGAMGGGPPGGGMGGPGGGGPGMGGGGGMGGPGGGGGLSGLSLDSLQEARVQTSTFAPEFGRTPGAQISMTSRGGSNAFHGGAYEYFRNHHLNANDWFANEAAQARGRMSQNQFGGTLGGPVIQNRTFFFLSAESNVLRVPSTLVASVPDMTSRAAAPSALRVYLRAFPKPNGPELDGGAARFTAVVTNPQQRYSYSARVDHSLNARDSLFVRYSGSPSDGTQRGSDFVSPNVWTSQESRSQAITGAWIRVMSGTSSNDLRVNYSGSNGKSWGGMDNFGGAVALTDAQVFPKGIDSTNGAYSMSILGLASYSLGARGRQEQRQINVVDGLSFSAGSHTYKVGADYRSQNSTTFNVPYSLMTTFNGLSAQDGSALSGYATMASVSSSVPEVYPSTTNYSFYAQDTWRADSRTTITYGVRWDVNPAPSAWKGSQPFAISSASETRVSQADPLYNTRWTDFAPRLGFVRQVKARPGRELVLRGGFGIFHDPGYGSSMSAFSGAPYSNVRSLTSPLFPLASSDLSAPVLPATKPYGQLGAAERTLQSPAIWQWNATLERSYGPAQVLSIGYAGTRGSRLLRTETRASYSDDYDVLRIATNGASSSYHALQAQFRRRFARNLQMQVSYTWAHSIDSASSDMGMGGFATLFGSGERGSSDYDIRHNLNASGSWLLPAPRAAWMKAALGNWWSDFLFVARTGTPFDIVGVSSASSNSGSGGFGGGLFAQVRPDYNGKPIWIDDSSVPGGRRLNRAAFDSPSGYAQGNLGRNALRGFGMSQLDLSLRRQLSLGEHRALHVAVQAFNLLNTPAFANPSRNEGASMTSANFGVASRMQTGGGSLFQNGGPRSLQLALRFQF